MDPVLASHAQLLAIQSTLVNRALEGLTEEEIWRRPTDRTNSIGWLVGHLTWARNGMLRCLGGEVEPIPWGRDFDRGAQVADRSTYPPTAEIVSALKRVNQKLRARMDIVTDAELSAPSPLPTPSPDKSARGVLAFMTFHEGYHLGQIAYVLKLIGRPGLVG